VNNKGFIFSLELILSIIVFMSVLVLVWSFQNYFLQGLSNNQDMYFMSKDAMQSLDVFLSKGQPNNWNLLDLNDVQNIGICSDKYVLDETKFSHFLDLNDDYNNVKNKLGLGKYELYVIFKENHDKNYFGISPLNKNKSKMHFVRYLKHKNDLMKVDYYVWKD
jgi:hypothetical protein